MSPLPTSPAHQQLETLQLAPDLVLRIGHAGKRGLDASHSESVRPIRDVFSTIRWRLVLSSNKQSTIVNHQPVRLSLGEVGSSISPNLSLIGSLQPPAAAPAKYASRAVRQSAADWLFDAIIRSVSPAQSAKDAAIRSFETKNRLSPSPPFPITLNK